MIEKIKQWYMQLMVIIHLNQDMDSWFAKLPYEKKMQIWSKEGFKLADEQLAKRFLK